MLKYFLKPDYSNKGNWELSKSKRELSKGKWFSPVLLNTISSNFQSLGML